jgi:hypothetical protein
LFDTWTLGILALAQHLVKHKPSDTVFECSEFKAWKLRKRRTSQVKYANFERSQNATFWRCQGLGKTHAHIPKPGTYLKVERWYRTSLFSSNECAKKGQGKRIKAQNSKFVTGLGTERTQMLLLVEAFKSETGPVLTANSTILDRDE